MKSTLCVLLAVLAVSALASPQPLQDNPYAPGMKDMILGWTDKDLNEQCRQKLPSVLDAYKSLLQTLITFDFEQIDTAFSALYTTYTAYPMCSYATNAVTQTTYLFVYNLLASFVATLGPQATKIFSSLERVFFTLTSGMEDLLQTSYVVISSYSVLTNFNSVSNTQFGEIFGYFMRAFILSLLYN